MKLLTKLIMAIIVVVVLGYAFIINHEMAHVKINEYNGCYDNEMSLGFFSGQVVPGDDCFTNSKEYDQVMLLHSLNEIEGYHSGAIYCVLLLIFIFNVIMMEE